MKLVHGIAAAILFCWGGRCWVRDSRFDAMHMKTFPLGSRPRIPYQQRSRRAQHAGGHVTTGLTMVIGIAAGWWFKLDGLAGRWLAHEFAHRRGHWSVGVCPCHGAALRAGPALCLWYLEDRNPGRLCQRNLPGGCGGDDAGGVGGTHGFAAVHPVPRSDCDRHSWFGGEPGGVRADSGKRTSSHDHGRPRP